MRLEAKTISKAACPGLVSHLQVLKNLFVDFLSLRFALFNLLFLLFYHLFDIVCLLLLWLLLVTLRILRNIMMGI